MFLKSGAKIEIFFYWGKIFSRKEVFFNKLMVLSPNFFQRVKKNISYYYTTY